MKYLFFILIISTSVLAAPTHIEIWFLSANKKAELLRSLDQNQQIKYSPSLVQNELACEPFGDFCFDPQIGLYKKTETGNKFDIPENTMDEKLPQLPVAHSVDRSIVSCDKSNAFDIF